MSDTDLLSSASPDAASPERQPAGQPAAGVSDAGPSTERPNEPSSLPLTGRAAEPTDNGAPARRRGGLSSMVLAELRQLAGQLGIADTAGMRKGDLIAAIKQRQGAQRSEQQPLPAGEPAMRTAGEPAAATAGEPAAATASEPAAATASEPAMRTAGEPAVSATVQRQPEPATAQPAAAAGPAEPVEQPVRRDSEEAQQPRQRRRAASRPAGSPERQRGDRQQGEQRQADQRQADQRQADQRPAEQRAAEQRTGEQRAGEQRTGEQTTGGERLDGRAAAGQGESTQQAERSGEPGQNGQARDDDGEDGGGRRRGRRFRDRRRNRGERRPEGGSEPEVREDDVLLPVAGILDVLENYAFVRTSGYLAGPNDVYVSLSLVRKYGLRRGDAITGAVRQPREGEQQRQKFNPLVRVDTINGLDIEAAKQRPEFTRLTPLYPNERLRLETESHKLTTRIIDLVMPVGKGQRALIVSPPKAGKTMVLQAIANAITTNNPECHLMVVLVDERPEEVTDMQRSVKGEVIASTFDRPPSDHTSVSELAIERAKRLVEMGHDVVVLLDSITRLGRAYNLAAPASGRILSGGVDSTALYPPKRFLGAARNIEGGGSLTIFATALVETGSTGDSVIFEEFKGTGNAELKLDRKIADRRVFPAVDVTISGTRKEELLLSPDEMAVTIKLRRVLTALDPQQAIDLLLDRLRKTRTNIEFLMQVAKTTPLSDED